MSTLIPLADLRGPAGGDFAGFFSPRTYGAVGGGADDTDAIIAMYAAAGSAAGAICVFSDRHGARGDIAPPANVVTVGVSAVDYVGSGTFVQAGLVGLDSTFRFRYGQIGLTDSKGDTPGAVRDLVIDGANVGGATELLRIESVNGRLENVFVIRSAGDAVRWAGAQNTIWTGGHVGACAGTAWIFSERVTGGQGCGGNKITGVYTFQWTDKCIEYAVASTASFWNHDNYFTDCLFEYFKTVPMDTFVHSDSGDLRFTRCVFTFSQLAATATDDCMAHVTQTAFSPLATTVVFNDCEFAGGVTTPPTDVILSDGANVVSLFGESSARGPDNWIGMITAPSAFRHFGPLDNAGGVDNVMRFGTGGSPIKAFHKQFTGVQYLIAPGTALNPIDIRELDDTGTRIAFGVTGVVTFGDGAGGILGAISSRIGGLNLTGIIQFLDGRTLQPNVVSGATGATSISSAGNALHLVELANNANATITITGSEEGRLITVAVLGQGTNASLLWGNTIIWGPTGAPAPPASGKWLVVDLMYINGGWAERARNDRPIVDGGVWTASAVVYPGRTYLLPTGGRGVVSATRTNGATWDATERAAWTFLAGGHYETIQAGTTAWIGPAGITEAAFRLKGGGGSGGGAGSGSSTTLQAGGGGGGAGVDAIYTISALVATTSYTCSVGAATSGGAGGASGGNTGVSGSNGNDTTITVAGVTYTAKGGGKGVASAANTTTIGNGGLYGTANISQGNSIFYPGGGSAGGNIPIPMGAMCGGAGGGAANASLGGNGGTARVLTAPGTAPAPGSGNTGTTAGGNGTTATEYGCGGGGGGGGFTGGAGGNGGGGAAGIIEVRF